MREVALGTNRATAPGQSARAYAVKRISSASSADKLQRKAEILL